MSNFRQRPRILVVEDSMLLAETICEILLDGGLVPVGPALTVERAVEMAGTEALEGAVVDITLSDGYSLPVGQVLAARQVPFLLLTGSKPARFHTEFQEVPILMKPFEPKVLRKAIWALIGHDNPGLRAA
jgi:DNA-binding response OmpR family regulator